MNSVERCAQGGKSGRNVMELNNTFWLNVRPTLQRKKIHASYCKSGPHVCGLRGLSAKILLMNTGSTCHFNSYLYTFRIMQLSDLTIHASLCKDNSQSKSSQLVRVQTVSLEYSAVTVTITLVPQRMRSRREIHREKVSSPHDRNVVLMYSWLYAEDLCKIKPVNIPTWGWPLYFLPCS